MPKSGHGNSSSPRDSIFAQTKLFMAGNLIWQDKVCFYPSSYDFEVSEKSISICLWWTEPKTTTQAFRWSVYPLVHTRIFQLWQLSYPQDGVRVSPMPVGKRTRAKGIGVGKRNQQWITKVMREQLNHLPSLGLFSAVWAFMCCIMFQPAVFCCYKKFLTVGCLIFEKWLLSHDSFCPKGAF